MDEPGAAARIAALERQLDEARQTIDALIAGEVDSITRGDTGAPMLLQLAQDKLHASEGLLRAVFDGSLDAKLVLDDEEKVIDANAAALALFDETKAALRGRSIREMTSTGHGAATDFLRPTDSGEIELVRPGRPSRHLMFRTQPHVLPHRHLLMLRDVTQHKEEERVLRETERRLATVISNAPVILFAIDREGVFTLYEGKGVELVGLRQGELVGQSFFHRQRYRADAATVLERVFAGESVRLEFEQAGFAFEGSLSPVLDSSGQVASAIGFAINVTERQLAEDTLRENEARLRAMFEYGDEGVLIIRRDGVVSYANPPAARILGIYATPLIGRMALDLVLPEDRPQLAERAAKLAQASGASHLYEIQIPGRGGPNRWIEMMVTNLVHEPTLRAFVANFRDITERKRAEVSLRQLAAIVESSTDAILSCDTTGHIQTWNRGAQQLLQYGADEVVGQPISMLYPATAVADLQRQLAALADGVAAAPSESLFMRKDGTLVDVAITTSALLDGHGDAAGASIIVRDVSDQRRAEAALRRTEEQLQQSQKMEAVGRLAGGIAHDFNNLLTVILSYTEMILFDLPESDPMRDDVREVHSAGQRATGLTRQLLAFSRKQILQPEVLDLNDVVQGVHRMLGRLLGEDIDLALALEKTIGKIYADSGQLEQVLLNLVVNARDAMPSGGNLTIETSSVTIDDAAAAPTGTVPGDYVVLAVTDTGAGMDRATQERIFEPFFTTKDKSKGTGLGLSTVYGIIQQSGGAVVVTSELGEGTTFRVYLPSTDRRRTEHTARLAPLKSLRGTETILLVEDDTPVRHLMRAILKKNGYNVLEAENGGEAFLISEQSSETIDLLLTDVVMPRMSGRQVAERLTAHRPTMKVLFVSGYTEDTIVRHGVMNSGLEFLAKPITPDTLLRKVRHVLDAPVATAE